MLRAAFECLRVKACAVSALLFLSMGGSLECAAKGEPRPDSESMQALLQAFVEAAPFVYSGPAFERADNRAIVDQQLQRFVDLAHGLGGQPNSALVTDPGLRAIGARLVEDAKSALLAFRGGNFDQARQRIRGVAGACFRCHTRTVHGPQRSNLELQLEQASLSRTELAEVYVATRQFDAALATLRQVLNGDVQDPKELSDALRQALAIAVRVKRDPPLAAALIDAALRNPGASVDFRELAAHWRRAVEAWRITLSEGDGVVESGGRIREAERLLGAARELQQFPLDQRADVLFLIASSHLHSFLATAGDSPQAPHAMYLLGQCYEVIRGLGHWYLNDVYFEACIRSSPHTQLARQCYGALELSVEFGYSGSSGLHIPYNVQQFLRRLRKMAN